MPLQDVTKSLDNRRNTYDKVKSSFECSKEAQKEKSIEDLFYKTPTFNQGIKYL